MKVAILSLYSGHVERGVEVWAESLKKSLEGKCDVTIIGNTKISIDWNKPDLRGKFLRNYFLDYWSILVARFTLGILADLKRLDPDIVIPTNGGWQALIIRLYCWLFRKKMIIVGHSGVGGDEFFNLLCFPDVFVSLSSETVKWAKKMNRLVKVEYIPNGIWLSEFSSVGKRVKMNMERPIFICVGAIEGGKRPALAIEAVSRLKRGSLLMLGGGEKAFEKEIHELGTTLLGKRFRQRQVPHSKIAKYYRTADVFTLPTWKQEAFGMVYLEAMACGLPVVTTDDPIKREIVGNAGIYIDPTNMQSYSQALEAAAKKKWGNAPQEQAEKFGWDEVGEKYYNLFKKLTNK